MKIEIIRAKNPRHIAGDSDSITMDVLFSHIPDFVQFTAKKDDSEEHGRELYSRAVFGEFGSIKVLAEAPPSEAEQQARLSGKLKQAGAAMAPLEDADKLGIISSPERDLLTKWQEYRVALYRLPQSAGWPANVEWPVEPLQS